MVEPAPLPPILATVDAEAIGRACADRLFVLDGGRTRVVWNDLAAPGQVLSDARAAPPAPPKPPRLPRLTRDAAVLAAEELAADLIERRLAAGCPLTERGWSVGVMAFYVRDRWPRGPDGTQATPSSVEKYINGAIRRGLVPPVREWPLVDADGKRPC